MASFEIRKDNRKQVTEAVKQKIANALEICGGKAETYAKRDCPVDLGTLRNSISHVVDKSESVVYIGTNVEYAPYVEFGTGIYYPDGGRKTPWVYVDRNGVGHRTNGQRPQPYLKPAVADHVDEYQNIIKSELQ